MNDYRPHILPRREALASLAALAFSPTLLAQDGAEVPPGVTIERDLVYATVAGGHELKADVYLPPESFGKSLPSLVYVHGGGWASGDKAEFAPTAAWMASRGYTGICINYRLIADAIWPAQIDDVKAAVRWVRANGKKLRAARAQIGMVGSSAGGHLAALTALTPVISAFGREVVNQKQRSDVRAVAAISPVLDFDAVEQSSPLYAEIERLLGVSRDARPKLWKTASPASYVNESVAATLFLHGGNDEIVSSEQSEALSERLIAARARSRVFLAPGAKHDFFTTPEWHKPALAAMFGFFEETLR